MVKSIGAQWVIINGPCLELSGTQWNDRPEFCPILSQVVEPDVTLPGAWNRVAIQAEIDRMRVLCAAANGAQSWADFIINMSESNLQQAQVETRQKSENQKPQRPADQRLSRSTVAAGDATICTSTSDSVTGNEQLCPRQTNAAPSVVA
jgi:hypothetical protein